MAKEFDLNGDKGNFQQAILGWSGGLAAALSLFSEEGCRSAKFGTITVHRQHLLYVVVFELIPNA